MKTIYKKLTLVCALILCFNLGQAQKSEEIQTTSIEDNSFYIKNVVDKRKDTTSIGLYINEWGKRKPFRPAQGLTHAAESSLANYYFNKESLPEIKGKNTVTIVINKFELKMERSSVEEFTGRINYSLDFYDFSNPASPEKLFEIQSYKDSVYNEYLAYVYIDIIDFLTGFSSQIFIDAVEIFTEKITTNKPSCATSFTSTNNSLILEKPKPLEHWTNLLTCNRTFSKYQKGWKISYYGYVENPSKDYFVPYVFSYNMTKSEDSEIIPKGMKSVNTYSIDLGTRFFVKLFPEVYANVELQIPLGWESVKYTEDKKRKYFLYGVSAAQGIYFIGKGRESIVLGVNVYERFVKSKVTPKDFGFSVELGIKF